MKTIKSFIISLLSICLLSSPVFAQNISVIGIGRLGLCMALCLEKAGHNVLGVDVSPEYIAQINNKSLLSLEPSVTEYLKTAKNFRATTSLKEALDFSDLYFIVVPTNVVTSKEPYDFTILSDLLSKINAQNVSNKHIVISATVCPGYIKNTARPLLKNCPNTLISYNPEFIAQGDIVRGLCNPDMVLIGEASPEIGDRLVGIYSHLCANQPHIARMSVESAEITKLALNCFITTKIAFANLIGDIADETPGADKSAILAAIGKDQRIGSKCLLPGYGFGGPCFPRDNRLLNTYATSIGIDAMLFKATDHVNTLHAEYQARKLLEKNHTEYVFEDVGYKPNCPVPIIEASQKLVVAQKIAEKGKKVKIIDNQNIISQVKAKYGNQFTYQVK